MNIPEKIKLTTEEMQGLKNLASAQQALQQFMAMITEQGERRTLKIREDGQTIWKSLAHKYQIDIENIMWDTTEDGYIKPVTVRLNA